MISILAIITIFLQIFTAGIALAGVYSFSVRYVSGRKKSDLYLTLIFLTFTVFAALVVASQLIYSLGQSLNIRFILAKFRAMDIVIAAFFILLFIRQRFSLRLNLITQILSLACLVELFLIIRSPLNIIENIKDPAIDPGIHFLFAIPPEWFWDLLWLMLGFNFISSARSTKEAGERNVDMISGVSAIMMTLAFFLSFFYSKTSEMYFMVGFWTVYLFSSIGFFIGNIIQPKDEIAKFPLSYFRTRILFKLVLIFIFLIIILLEATTVATISLNQMSLQRAIKSNYMSLARNIADKIEYMAFKGGSMDRRFVQNLVLSETKEKRYVYVISGNGRVFMAAQPGDVGRDISRSNVAKKVISGKYGSDEYLSEFYEQAADKNVIGAYAPVGSTGLYVIVEEPKWSVYSEIRIVSTNTLILVIVGIILTVSAGIFFAKSIEDPIKEVIHGTEAIGKGDLTYKIRINSIDEIGQLADAFNRMTRQLKQDQENLVNSEKLASLGTMAAGMAHEIKNPLVSLRTFTQLLPQRFQDEEFRKKFAAVVPQEIDKINRIAESLLRFGRPNKPELTQVSVNDILEEILALFDNEARKNNVKITTKMAELPKITADAGQLSQALVNIILNSIQSMQNGGELTVKTDVGEVVKLTPSSGDAAEEEVKPVPVVFVEVTDTGVGIPEENLKKIFDPFFTTKEVGGTGMGLPITLRIIEEHYGTIKVRSQIGKGTTFLITLPQSHEEKA